MSSQVFSWLYGHIHIELIIGDFNIDEFSEKSPIANINSFPINSPVWYRWCPVISAYLYISAHELNAQTTQIEAPITYRHSY